MSLNQVITELKTLTRLEKIRLIQLLARELEDEAKDLLEPGKSYPIPPVDQSFEAAAALLEVLALEKELR